MSVGGSIVGGDEALGERENLRWNKFSSFILISCWSPEEEITIQEMNEIFFQACEGVTDV